MIAFLSPVLPKVSQWTDNEIVGYAKAKDALLMSVKVSGIKYGTLRELCDATLKEMKKNVATVRTYDSINARLRNDLKKGEKVASELMTFITHTKTALAPVVTPSVKRKQQQKEDEAPNKLPKRQLNRASEDDESDEEDCLSSAGIT